MGGGGESISVRLIGQTEDSDCTGSMHACNIKQSIVQQQGALAQGVGSNGAR